MEAPQTVPPAPSSQPQFWSMPWPYCGSVTLSRY